LAKMSRCRRVGKRLTWCSKRVVVWTVRILAVSWFIVCSVGLRWWARRRSRKWLSIIGLPRRAW